MTYPSPSQAAFEDLARSDPERLVMWTQSGQLAATDLTFAVEVTGSISTTGAQESLLALLKNTDPVVREGAVYGLA